MSSKTNTLQLTLTGNGAEDKNLLFETWRQRIDGEGLESNMKIIDDAIADDRARITFLEQASPDSVTEVNGKTGPVINLVASDVNARPGDWTPTIDEVDGLRAALESAGDVKTWNGIAPNETGDIVAEVIHIDLSGMETGSGKPGKPSIALKIGDQFFYPITSADQVILSDGTKLEIDGRLNIPVISVNGVRAIDNNVTLKPEYIGAADAQHSHEEYANAQHDHSQYVESGSSVTFDVVTATKVIGAVYA